jgi:DNA-binding response OmpR family regulator
MQRPPKAKPDMRVDFARHEVWISNREVELTRREWQILMLLLERPGCLVPTDKIFQEFFGDAWAEIDTRGLSQHLTRLRRKIGYERIETIPHFGLKFRGSVRVV